MTFDFFFHVLFHRDVGEGTPVITLMTPDPPLLNPAFLHEGLIAFGTDKHAFDVMDIFLVLHRPLTSR